MSLRPLAWFVPCSQTDALKQLQWLHWTGWTASSLAFFLLLHARPKPVECHHEMPSPPISLWDFVCILIIYSVLGNITSLLPVLVRVPQARVPIRVTDE